MDHDAAGNQIARIDVLRHMDEISDRTKADIFLLNPKQMDTDSASTHGNMDGSIENRLRIVLFGDMECCEHAKTRVLIMIDQIVCTVLSRILDTNTTNSYHSSVVMWMSSSSSFHYTR